ncbi:MAG: hypothetical protein ABW217_01805, partial [Polyangiaceae bacterium]
MNTIINEASESVTELSEHELMLITGGGWLDDAWDWTKEAVNDAADWVEEAAEDVADFAEDAVVVAVDVVNWLDEAFKKIDTTTDQVTRV